MRPLRVKLIAVFLCISSTASAGGIATVLGKSPGIPRSYHGLRAELETEAGPEKWQSFRNLKWQPYTLRQRWIGEHQPGFVSKGKPRKPVLYLRTARMRAPYRVTIGADGLLYDARNKLVEAGPLSLAVADSEGNLYIRDSVAIARDEQRGRKRSFLHSTLLGGGEAEMSFEIQVKDGRVVHLTNRSGHYRPSRMTFVSWLLGIEQKGLDLSQAMVEFDPKSVVDDVSDGTSRLP
jgi:hypothetical protein